MSDSVLTDYMRQQFEQAGDTGFTCLEAEENILRRMIMRQGAAEDVVFELSPSDFADKTHAMIYRAIQSLVSAHKQADLISIDAEMTRLYGEGGWNPVELAKVATKNQTTIANWQYIKDLIKIVRDLSVRRHAIASIEELVGGLRDPTKDISETLNEIQTAGTITVQHTGTFSGLYVLEGNGTLKCGERNFPLEKTAQFFVPAGADDLRFSVSPGEKLTILQFFGPQCQTEKL